MTQVKILDESVCLSVRANALGKGINPSVPTPSMGKYKGRLCSLSLFRQPVKENEKSEFKLVAIRN